MLELLVVAASDDGKVPKIQILTIEELFAGKRPQIPMIDPGSFKKAQKEAAGKQGGPFSQSWLMYPQSR